MRFGVFSLLAWVLCLLITQSNAWEDHTHYSQEFGKNKTYRIYFPGDYSSTSKRYPVIYFFHGWGGRYNSDPNARYDSTLIEPMVANSQTLDTAVLRLNRPGHIDWRPLSWCPPPHEADETVWFVGRDRRWFVPKGAEAGRLYNPFPDPEDDRLSFGTYAVEEGVSGAPLISSRGIIGTVVNDLANQARAVDIA